MSFNLITTPWLPVRRRSGDMERVSPCQINDRIAEDPIVGFAWPRPDFNGAAHEFLIGLLSTAAPPEDEDAWDDWWAQPPMPDDLQRRFERYADAFDLDGAGPRFLQDHDPLEGAKREDAATLLIDAPGTQTLHKNTDLFVKRSDGTALCRGAAAMALFTLSAYAPLGGRGYRTSLRGGGPMTTLAVVDHEKLGETLWGRLWPNVETSAAIKERDDPGRRRTEDDSLVFPWLAPTRTSDKGGKQTSQSDVHPLQVYWGMPRRIRLEFEDSQGQACSLTGSADSMVVKRYRTKIHGVDYTSETFTHPLSPYYRPKAGAPHLPIHPKPGGLTYRLWPDLVCRAEDGLRERALAVENWLSTRHDARRERRLAAFGYDMANWKARAWMEGEVPLWCLGPERQGRVDYFIQHATAGAEAVAGLLTRAIKAALNGSKNARGDYGFVAEAFYRRTEETFQARLKEAVDAIDEQPDAEDPTKPVREAFCASIAKVAREIFDYHAPMDCLEDRNMNRHVRALFHLSVGLRGQGLYRAFDIERALAPSREEA